MKFLVILAVAVASAAAAEIPYVKSDESLIRIVRSDFESHPDGQVSSVVETGNTQSEGVVKNANTGSHDPNDEKLPEEILRIFTDPSNVGILQGL